MMNFEQLLNTLHLPFASNWIVQLCLIFAGMMFVLFIERRYIRKALGKFQRRQGVWDLSVTKAIQKPLAYMIWLVGLSMMGQVLRMHVEDPTKFQWLTPIPSIGGVILINWFLLRLITNLEKNIVKKRVDAKENIDKTTAGALRRLAQAFVIILSSLIILQILHIPISGVLAFGASAGVSLGFAAKDLLANFFGTLIVYLDRPFAVGDHIKIGSIEGQVEEIGWRITKLRSMEKRSIYVPNASFTSGMVENCSRMSHRCINDKIAIRYTDTQTIKKIVDDIALMLDNHSKLDTSQRNIIALERLGDSAMELRLKAYSTVLDYAAFMQVGMDIWVKISDIITFHGAEIAYPTNTVVELKPFSTEAVRS